MSDNLAVWHLFCIFANKTIQLHKKENKDENRI